MNLESAREKLKQQRRKIENLREQYRKEADLDESQQDSTGALSSHDQHPGDQASETFEREKEVSIDEQLEGQLREIDAALERVEEGTYGRCEIGGEEIDEERLGLLPATRYCRQHRDEAEDEFALEHGTGMDAALIEES